MVLTWIKNNKELLKFEKGRVKEIIRNSKQDQWNYVSTKENPADILSRGATFEKLAYSDLWKRGPNWLKEDILPITIEDSEEKLIEPIVCPVVKAKINPFHDPLCVDSTRFKSLEKLVGVVAKVLKWLKISRKGDYVRMKDN